VGLAWSAVSTISVFKTPEGMAADERDTPSAVESIK